MLSRLSPLARIGLVAAAIVAVVAVLVGVAIANQPRPAPNPPAAATIDPGEQGDVPSADGPSPTAHGTAGAADDDAYHAQGTVQPQMLSPEDSARLAAYAQEAAVAFVTYDSGESIAARSSRLQPYFGSGGAATDIPILARQDLLDRSTGWSSKVQVLSVPYTAEVEPAPGDEIQSVRYAVNISYQATWPNAYTSGLSQSGAQFWTVYIPLQQAADGSWQVRDPSLVTIEEPDIDTGANP